MAYNYTWDVRGTETMCALIRLNCQLDMTLGHLGRELNEALSKSDWPLGVSVEYCYN